MKYESLLEQFRTRGFVLAAAGGGIILSPKKLINERLINFVRKHKEGLLTALYQEQDVHRGRKNALGHRMKVLRNFIKAAYGNQWRYDNTCLAELDEAVNETLMKYNYDLELAIDCWRPLSKNTPVHEARHCGCGYVPPFCSCFT